LQCEAASLASNLEKECIIEELFRLFDQHFSYQRCFGSGETSFRADTDRYPVYLIGSEPMVRSSTILELCAAVAQDGTVVIATVGAVLLWKPRGYQSPHDRK
jgi:hypothetical protein